MCTWRRKVIWCKIALFLPHVGMGTPSSGTKASYSIWKNNSYVLSLHLRVWLSAAYPAQCRTSVHYAQENHSYFTRCDLHPRYHITIAAVQIKQYRQDLVVWHQRVQNFDDERLEQGTIWLALHGSHAGWDQLRVIFVLNAAEMTMMHRHSFTTEMVGNSA